MSTFFEKYQRSIADQISSNARMEAQTGEPNFGRLGNLLKRNLSLGRAAGINDYRVIELENEGFKSADLNRKA